ncbi:MAG TPA: D-2-hydroxyacid dehydrogenase [Chloroflexota bacterium]
MKLVVAPGGGDAALAERIRAAAPGVTVALPADRATLLREIADADAFYGNVDPETLAAARRLRWIQSPEISLERFMFPALIEHPVVMTNPRGIYAEHIADHVMGFVLCLARGFHRYRDAQHRRVWKRGDDYPTDVVHLPDATIGIFGLGGIGAAIAPRARAFGMRVLAVDARVAEPPPAVDRLWGPDRLIEMLSQADFVAICTPETPETRGLFDDRMIGAMKPGSYLINIGRGKVVKLDAVVAALRSGQLAGVGLDVFESEPLPADHPLWGFENALLTPHVAGAGPHTAERRTQILIENLRRFVAGEPLVNVVDKARWF